MDEQRHEHMAIVKPPRRDAWCDFFAARAFWWASAVIAILAVGSGLARAGPPQAGAANPDALYAERATLANALAAADEWERRLRADPREFESAWKLARACYWLGGHVPAKERRSQYERGIEAGQQAVAAEPRRPEGHFWLAANMGTMAESFGLRAGLKYRGPVKKSLETVVLLDRAYGQGAADRALGRWYRRVPGWLGGSKRKAIEHLLKSLEYDPTSAASHFFLAETYEDLGRNEDVRRELRAVLEAPRHPEWVPEVIEYQERARALLAKLR